MPVMLRARSVQEAALYLEMQSCGSCDEPGMPTATSEISDVDGRPVVRFAGPCPACGAERGYEFAIEAGQPGAPAFGGADRSTLLDPGAFLWAGDRAAGKVPVDITGLDAAQREDAVAALQYAIAALDEVVKFIPAHALSVPQASFTTELGQALFRADPQRFSRDEITDRIASYRRGLADLGVRQVG